MAVSLEILKSKIGEADELQQIAKELMGNLEKHLEESPDKFQEIKNAYLAKIASQQANILSDFPEFQQWSKVDSFLEKAEKFSKHIGDALLNPERTEFLGLFEKWLQGIEVSLTSEVEAWLKSCLKSASGASIAKLKGRITKVSELSKELKGSILSQVKIMIANELVRLTKLDKTTVDNLVAWMEKAEEALSKGSNLLNVWNSIKEEQADESFAKAPIKEIIEKFDNLVESKFDRKLLESEGFDKAMEFWEEVGLETQREWTKLKPRCPVITSQYNQLSEHAKSLLVKEIVSWNPKKLEEINTSLKGLTETVGKVIEFKDILKDIEANWSSLEALDKNSQKPDLKALVNEFASIHSSVSNLSTKPSLREYLQELDNLNASYNQWLCELEKLRGRWVEETKPWIDICKRQGLEILTKLEQGLSSLQELNAQSNTIAEITNKHLEIKSTIQQIRDTLLKGLSKEKLHILDKIAELEAEKGEALIEDLKQKLGGLEPVDLNNIVSLSEEARLISVRISTGG